MKLQEITKEEMVIILSSSKSMREVIMKFSLSPNGSGGYRNIKKKIVDLGIDIPIYHYYGNGENRRIVSNFDIFCENSTYPRQSLKRRIIRDNLLKYECMGCGNKGNHNGKSLSLHLDHKNGVNNDNRLDNLRFLCPNCHSQTETYSGKANKLIKLKVPKERPRKVERPHIDILLNEIKENGYSATGRKYGVSDNAIRKWIK
jgi:Zn finger protein HypA/HybF involved in hydrogenase expression